MALTWAYRSTASTSFSTSLASPVQNWGAASTSFASGTTAFILAFSTSTITAPSGLTSVASGTTGSFAWQLFVWDGVVTGATSYTFTFGSTRNFIGMWGVTGATGYEIGTATAANSTTATAASVTPTNSGAFVAAWLGDLTTNGGVWSVPAALTFIYSVSIAGGGNPRLSGSAGYGTATAGVATGDSLSTHPTAGQNVGFQVVIWDTPLNKWRVGMVL